MSGGRGHAILYLSQGSHQRSFEDGPTSPSTTVITPQSQALSSLCRRPVPAARLAKRWRRKLPVAEILPRRNTTCFLQSA